jgi:hypothetical protein
MIAAAVTILKIEHPVKARVPLQGVFIKNE